MIRKILVAYDGSTQSEKAYDLALDMASRYSAQMIVLSVARPAEPAIAVEAQTMLESAMGYYEGHFKTMNEKALELGVEPRFEVLSGHPAERIVDFANREGIDVIIMGHRGEGFLQRWLLGSVAKRVLSYAPCTVIVVR